MFFKKIDFLSPPITLYRKEELCHSSIFSGILTIISYLILIIIGLYYFIDFIQRKNFSAYYFNRYIEDAGFYPLNSSAIFSFIQIIDSKTANADPIDFDSIRIIGFNEEVIDNLTFDKNLSNFNHWYYGYCNNDSDIKGIEDIVYSARFTNSACIRKYFNKTEQKYYNTSEKGFIWPSIEKGCSHPNRTFYGIIIEKCRNDSSKNNCKTQKEINNYILTHSVNFQFIDQYIDVYNFDKPLKKFFSSVSNGLYVGSLTSNHLNFNPMVVKTHRGIFFDEKIEEFSYFFEQNEKITYNWGENDDIGLYVAFYFWMQNRMQYYERSYKKLVDILANIGGANNSILFIAGIINKVINQYIIILDMQDLIIDLDRKMKNKINYKKNYDTSEVRLNSHNEKKYNHNNNILQPLRFVGNENNKDKSIINNNDRSVKYSYSIGGKYTMTNNLLLPNKNEILTVINKKGKNNTQYSFPICKKNNEYKLIKKISFNFLEYLYYKICKNKRNKMLVYESFRKKIISEEQFIQNYINIYKLVHIYMYSKEELKINGKFNMSLIINSIGPYN